VPNLKEPGTLDGSGLFDAIVGDSLCRSRPPLELDEVTLQPCSIPLSTKGEHMPDKLEQLKGKYQSVLNFISQQQNAQLQNVNMEGDKLFIRATVPSQEVKNRIWDQIKLVDPNFYDLSADIQAPTAAAATAGGGGGTLARTYTVQAGDNLSKISKHFYGDPNQYMKIVNANKDKLPDPDKIKPGMELSIP
jgi:LysM repeat protein